MDPLRHPPLTSAAVSTVFQNNLHVSETRAKFHDEIKGRFPFVYIPTIKDLTYDLADCQFTSADHKSKVATNISSFTYETESYAKRDDFWNEFEWVFQKFAEIASLREVAGVNLKFQNAVRIDPEIGANFLDYFTLDLVPKTTLPMKMFQIVGAINFATEDGFLQIAFEPPKVGILEAGAINFSFQFFTASPTPVDKTLSAVKIAFESGHKRVEDVFRSILTSKYWDKIK